LILAYVGEIRCFNGRIEPASTFGVDGNVLTAAGDTSPFFAGDQKVCLRFAVIFNWSSGKLFENTSNRWK